jgi:prepilin-type N-terminal cleavage/methylation domain-containing protein
VNARRTFTLLELLVVIAIISILLVAVIPALNFSKSSGRKSAISNLLGTIEQARAQALKDGQPTYVVFPAKPASGSSLITDKAILDRYFYHSVAIFEDEPANPATPKQITNWKTFPTGVSLRSAISWWSSANFTFTPAGSPQSFPYLKFNANGEVESPTPTPAPSPTPTPSSVQLSVFEGFVDPTGPTDRDTSSAKFSETIQISRLTGRAEYTP